MIDADSHVAEPPDLWTSRVARKYGDDVPRLVHDERHGLDRWMVGGRLLTAVANWATAGWHEHPPSYPPTIEEADPGAFEPGGPAASAWTSTASGPRRCTRTCWRSRTTRSCS